MFGEHGTPSSRKGLCISLRRNLGKSFCLLGIPPLPPHSLALRASRILGFILTGSLCTTKSELFLAKIRTPNFEKLLSSGGPHSKSFGLLRGKQKARIFVYPVGKRSFSFGARPRLPVRSRKAKEGFSAAAEFHANFIGAPPKL